MRREIAGDASTWLVAGTASVCLAAVIAVACVLIGSGLAPFWPKPLVEVTLTNGRSELGEIVAASGGIEILRTSERERVGSGYVRVAEHEIVAQTFPRDAFVVTLADGRRLFGRGDASAVAELSRTIAPNAAPDDALWPNALGGFGRAGIFLREFSQFLGASGVGIASIAGALPALVGTLTLVLLMSVIVMPFGVATAVYLHERSGRGARIVQSAITNLAGVPSIVYGVLGLGLFVHGFGAGIDRVLFADRLPVPTFGAGGLLWAALTLALLTLPVVVVSVGQGLASLPASLRAGSLALGATRGETMWRLLLPAARPALLTGLILAVARAAGAVAPLMLVGVVKLAPALPVDGEFPFLHPSRQFMHLGFAVYDSALASPDAVRGIPRAFACALLLVGVVIALNLIAIVLRQRLRDRYRALES